MSREQRVVVYKIASMLDMRLKGTRNEVTEQALKVARRGANFVTPDTRLLVMNDVKGGVPSTSDVLEEIDKVKVYWNEEEPVKLWKTILKIEEMLMEIEEYG